MSENNGRPPRDNLFRAQAIGYEMREDDEGRPVLAGHFNVFNTWTEINSIFEGRFMERFMPGAFRKTIKESRDRMRVLFQHGRDPQIGDKVLGPIEVLREDETGPYYEVPLLDTNYNNEILPGLRKNLYGASFRFRVTREEFDKKPKKSAQNPDGIPERTVNEAEVSEFGPVTFPAYADATAGIRSLTDEFMVARLAADPEHLNDLVDFLREAKNAHEEKTPDAPPILDAGESHLEQGRRVSVAKFLAERSNRDG